MIKNISRIIAGLMSLFGVCFVCYAFNHPEMSFPWNNTITYVIYGIYVAITIFLFIAPFKDKKVK